MSDEYEPVPVSELTPASEVENTDKLLVQGADGLLKTATRAQVNAYVQTEIDTEQQVRANEDTDIRQTFTRFQVVSSVPDVEDMLPRVLYLYNATGDVYQGYYLIEGVSASQNSRGQIGGRSYTGINGITVDFENATISNDLVTDGGTIGDDLTVNGKVTINDDATITGKVEVGNGLDVTGDLSATGDATVGGDAGITGGLSVGGATTIGGNTQVNGNLDITGNITQHGSAYETHAEKLYTKKDMIYLRDGAVSPLGSDEVTGLCAKNYDLEGNDGVLVFNRDGTARVGDKTANKTITVYSYDGTTFYKAKTDITVYSENGTDFYQTKTDYTVYSSDGETFYADSELTEPVTIPSGVTPTLVEDTEYTYYVLSDAITLETSATLIEGIEYSYPELSVTAAIPSGVTPVLGTGITYTYTADVDDTQPLLTRSEETELDNNDILMWNSTQKKAVNVPRPSLNNTVLTAKIQNNQTTYEWKSGGSGQVAVFATRADYLTALAIPEGSDGYLQDKCAVIILNETSYVEGEERNV